MKKTILPLLLTTAPLFAGEPAPVMAPPSPCDCPQGWTVGLEILGLKPYQSDGIYDGDMDAGLRGSLGFQFSDCMFTKVSGFGYETDAEVSGGSLIGSVIDLIDIPGIGSHDLDLNLTLGYVDVVVGQTFGQCDKLTLSPYVGLCWAKFEEELSFDGQIFDSDTSFDASQDFTGFGIVVGIDATRSLGNNFSLYGKAKQSVVFGDTDTSADVSVSGQVGAAPTGLDDFGGEADDVAFISEVGLGVQYDFAFSNVAANVRLGVEGQWWSGVSSIDSADIGLAGVVLGANFRF